MNIPFGNVCRRSLLATLLLLVASVAGAAPGAHGPGGEHLDETTRAGSGAASPRVEAKSELFELVARLQGGALSILIDRYDTNEPVLGAKLEVESGAIKAVAKFDADRGDYAVTDPALLKALSAPGEHALVFTLVAGPDSDLLDGTLLTSGVSAAVDGPGHSHAGGPVHDHDLERAAWVGAAVLALGAIGLVAWLRQRKRGGSVGEVAP